MVSEFVLNRSAVISPMLRKRYKVTQSSRRSRLRTSTIEVNTGCWVKDHICLSEGWSCCEIIVE